MTRKMQEHSELCGWVGLGETDENIAPWCGLCATLPLCKRSVGHGQFTKFHLSGTTNTQMYICAPDVARILAYTLGRKGARARVRVGNALN